MNFVARNEVLAFLREKEEAAGRERQLLLAEAIAEADKLFTEAWKFPFPPFYRADGYVSVNINLFYVSGYTFFGEEGWATSWEDGGGDDMVEVGAPSEGPFPFSDLLLFIRDFEARYPGLRIVLSDFCQRA